MMRVGNLKGKMIKVRQVNPAELTPYQKKRADEARRRATSLARSSRRLISAARCDVDGFEASSRWYVARCRAGQEQRIAEELAEMNIECWCPIKEVRRRKRFGEGVVFYETPVFHGYVFVRLMPHAESWMGALSASRLTAFIGHDGVPAAIADRLINMLRLNAKRKPENDDDVPLKVRDRVDVTDGHLAGFQATVRRLIPKHWRVELDVEIFGRMTLVELDIDQVTR